MIDQVSHDGVCQEITDQLMLLVGWFYMFLIYGLLIFLIGFVV